MALDIGCTIKQLPTHQIEAAAARAISINPANWVSAGKFISVVDEILKKLGITPPGPATPTLATPGRLAVMVGKYWGTGGVHLTVGFLDGGGADLQARIVSHMNAWGPDGPGKSNVKFSLTNTDPQVRITRTPGQGYYSYLGTDILGIPANQNTMNLDSFTMDTPESEFHRVVRHETGHTLGFPHEHMRAQLVARLDPRKTIAFFEQTQGWSAQEIMQQVLTPLPASSIRATANADQDSIMCYQLPGSITIDGQPITGGVDIDPLDQQFAASIYPLAVSPPVVNPPVNPPPVNPPTGGGNVFAQILALMAALKAGDWLGAFKILLALASSIQTGAISKDEVEAAHTAVAAAAPK